MEIYVFPTKCYDYIYFGYFIYFWILHVFCSHSLIITHSRVFLDVFSKIIRLIDDKILTYKF